MYKPFSEDLSCDEVKRVELLGESAINAYRRVISIFRSGKPGLYLLMGDYGSGKTLIVRKASAVLGSGRVVIRSFKYINSNVDLSCSSGRSIMGYVIDNFELFFQEPETYIALTRDYISISSYYPVLFVISLPLVISNIDKYGDVVNIIGNIPERDIIRISFKPEETRSILERMGIRVNESSISRYMLKSPGLGIRALTSSKRRDDSIDIIIV